MMAHMREVLIALGIFALLGAVPFLIGMATWQGLVIAGGVLLALGMLIGVPCGVVYHVLLHRALAPKGRLVRNWIWRPIAQHVHLESGRERLVVLAWCYVAAGGWGLSMLGCVLLGIAAVMGP